MVMLDRGWGYLCDKSKPERKEALYQYAVNYVEPVLENYPELKGKVYLALRKHGFFAEYDPVNHIIVPENASSRYGKHLLLSITAHEMGHILQYEFDIEKDKQSLWTEMQATVISWERGFAKDFILSFPENCSRSTCCGKEKHGYFHCNLFFEGCCRNCSVRDMDRRAEKLEAIAREYKITDVLNVTELKEKIKKAMCG